MVQVSATERERPEFEERRRAPLERELALERALGDFAVQAINLTDDQVPGAIRRLLGDLGERLGLERCSVFRVAGDSALAESTVVTAAGSVESERHQLTSEFLPWSSRELLAGRIVSFASRNDIAEERDRETFARAGIEAGVCVPFRVASRVAGAIGIFRAAPRRWPAGLVQHVDRMGGLLGHVFDRLRREEELRRTTLEARRLKDELQAENVYLRREERERLGGAGIVGQSPAFVRVMQQISQVAATNSTVLLLGETGTGKELFATQIHELSTRHTRAMVRVNCAAIPATLIESELFGREKGAFTGALARQSGRFELADQSTIFLDEIGDLPSEVQVKLLRVVEERTVERLGSPRPIIVDTRIVAATHRNLEQRVQEGSFREDLYYRLNVFPIQVPPLRERIEDIPLLVWRFVEEFSKAFGKRVDTIDRDSLAALQEYQWPGNIRELRNTVERAMIVATNRRLTIALPHASSASARRSTRLADVERDHIRSVLESTRWRIRGPGGAADRLAVKPTTLETRMAKLGIRRPKEG